MIKFFVSANIFYPFPLRQSLFNVIFLKNPQKVRVSAVFKKGFFNLIKGFLTFKFFSLLLFITLNLTEGASILIKWPQLKILLLYAIFIGFLPRD